MTYPAAAVGTAAACDNIFQPIWFRGSEAPHKFAETLNLSAALIRPEEVCRTSQLSRELTLSSVFRHGQFSVRVLWTLGGGGSQIRRLRSFCSFSRHLSAHLKFRSSRHAVEHHLRRQESTLLAHRSLLRRDHASGCAWTVKLGERWMLREKGITCTSRHFAWLQKPRSVRAPQMAAVL